MKIFKEIAGYVKRNPRAWLVLYLPVYIIMFLAVERHVPAGSDYWVSYMPFDDKIPFLEWFVVPYCTWYPFLIFTGLYLMATDARSFYKYVCFLAVGFTVTLVFCYFVPNGQDLRPESFARKNAFTWAVSLLYKADTNTNVFPSMHVVGAVGAVCAAFYSERMKGLRLPWLIIAFLISISTVFIKQHSVLDIIGGVALCVPLYFFIYFLPKIKKRGHGHETRKIP